MKITLTLKGLLTQYAATMLAIENLVSSIASLESELPNYKPGHPLRSVKRAEWYIKKATLVRHQARASEFMKAIKSHPTDYEFDPVPGYMMEHEARKLNSPFERNEVMSSRTDEWSDESDEDDEPKVH